MMPLHLVNAGIALPLTIVDDNARMPSEDLLEKSCNYRRKRRTVGVPPPAPLPATTKPSRWDAIPVSKKLPNSAMPRASMSLNDCARITLRRPMRSLPDTIISSSDKSTQPLRRPTRTTGYADAASILELALAEVNFSDIDDSFSSCDDPLFSIKK